MAIVRLPTPCRNAIAQAVRDLIDSGSGPGLIKLYADPMPADPNDAPAGTLLGTLTLADPCAPDPTIGELEFDTIEEDASADATGEATWARITSSDGTKALDVDVGDTGSGAVIELNTTNIVAGGPIVLTAFNITMPES